MAWLPPLEGGLLWVRPPPSRPSTYKTTIMANEQYWKITHRYRPATTEQLPVSVPTIEKYFDQTGTEAEMGQRDIGTSEETIVWTTDIGDEGWVVFKNLDPTNYVQWGFSTGVYGGRLSANGGFAIFELEPAATLYFLADTASCKVQYFVYEK